MRVSGDALKHLAPLLECKILSDSPTALDAVVFVEKGDGWLDKKPRLRKQNIGTMPDDINRGKAYLSQFGTCKLHKNTRTGRCDGDMTEIELESLKPTTAVNPQAMRAFGEAAAPLRHVAQRLAQPITMDESKQLQADWETYQREKTDHTVVPLFETISEVSGGRPAQMSTFSAAMLHTWVVQDTNRGAQWYKVPGDMMAENAKRFAALAETFAHGETPTLPPGSARADLRDVMDFQVMCAGVVSHVLHNAPQAWVSKTECAEIDQALHRVSVHITQHIDELKPAVHAHLYAHAQQALAKEGPAR